ncbi:MAG: Flp pilus assembly complex ATPase component TadA, partial [Gammaproteobacteria bacterium]|nr:Flp pilus assembly complex ATPase component TadA [Gammaproteobacteria bacterium]
MDISAQNRPYAGDERQLALGEVLEALIRDGHITADQARPLLSAYSHKQPADYGSHPLEIVARRKWHSLATPEMALSLERLTRWYAERSQLRYFRIDPLKVDVKAVTGVITRPYAERFQILPVEVDGDRVVVACAEPFRRDWEAELSRVLRIKIDRVFANPADVRRYLAEFYNLSQAIAGANRVHELADKSGVLNLEALLELGRADQLDANDHHVVNLVDWLLQYAFDQRASDIHLEPRRDKARIRFRIDGVLHTVNEIPPVVMAAVTSRIKSLGRMDIVEKRRPQDGRLKTRAPGGSEIELRLSTMPTAFGEKLVMRVFDPEVLKRSFDQLGLSAEDA